mmetsp:Transcript_41685/g.98038  ORF Transcript_41685/g.98038 Transcript_41685/m.98038 type:complete len:129 (-) Transcript_41685:292-678(-)
MNNLILYPDAMPFEDTTNTPEAMAFQVNGFGGDSFVNNTVVSVNGQIYGDCFGVFSGRDTPTTGDNTFYIQNGTFSSGGCGSKSKTAETFAQWTKQGQDKASVVKGALSSSDTLHLVTQWLRDYLPVE